jgi:hypothetical protein
MSQKTNNQLLNEILGRLKGLEETLGLLLQIRQRPAVKEPLWPHYPAPYPTADDARCPVCNNRYADMTHYVCNHAQCPSAVRCQMSAMSFGEPS